MGKMGRMNATAMMKLQKQMDSLRGSDRTDFLAACARELAARLLALTIKATPVGVYREGSGKTGGTLRRGWTSRTGGEAASGGNTSAKAYAESLPVTRAGNKITVDIVNPVEYASYVEYGHRTSNGAGWVPGRFMLTLATEELRRAAPAILEKKILAYLKRYFE